MWLENVAEGVVVLVPARDDWLARAQRLHPAIPTLPYHANVAAQGFRKIRPHVKPLRECVSQSVRYVRELLDQGGCEDLEVRANLGLVVPPCARLVIRLPAA